MSYIWINDPSLSQILIKDQEFIKDKVQTRKEGGRGWRQPPARRMTVEDNKGKRRRGYGIIAWRKGKEAKSS